MLDRRGIREVQKSQEEFGLEPFRNPVSFWQSWLRTWGWRGVNNKSTQALALLSQYKTALGTSPPELPQHSQLCPQVLLILRSWSFQKTQGTWEVGLDLYPKCLICGLLSVPVASF